MDPGQEAARHVDVVQEVEVGVDHEIINEEGPVRPQRVVVDHARNPEVVRELVLSLVLRRSREMLRHNDRNLQRVQKESEILTYFLMFRLGLNNIFRLNTDRQKV